LTLKRDGGIEFNLEPFHRNIEEKTLIDDLKKVASQLNKNSVTIEEYNDLGKFHACTFHRRFGSWLKALDSAGLERTRNLNISNEALFMDIYEVWIKKGRQPRYTEMGKPHSSYSPGTFENRFGTWRKALEAFVEFINQENEHKSSDILVGQNEFSGKSKLNSYHRTKRRISWRMRFLVMRRDQFKCCFCGKTPATDPETVLHVDHKTPWSKGGESIFENLQTLCMKCNIGKSDLLV
jgi:Homing endonuclease associated repeat/HNH endonuclease